jgi:hypothetical protein
MRTVHLPHISVLLRSGPDVSVAVRLEVGEFAHPRGDDGDGVEEVWSISRPPRLFEQARKETPSASRASIRAAWSLAPVSIHTPSPLQTTASASSGTVSSASRFETFPSAPRWTYESALVT